MSFYNVLSLLRRLALCCLPMLALSSSWSYASSERESSLPSLPLTPAQVREALFARSHKPRAPGSSASASSTPKRASTPPIKELSCWYELVDIVAGLTKQGKRVLIASDIDETILCPRFFTERYREDYYQEYGRQAPRYEYHLCQEGLDRILASFMASDRVDVIAITKRDRSQAGVLASQLRAQNIDFVAPKNPVFLTPARIKSQGLVLLSKPDAYWRNVIMTEQDEKADYIFEFLAASSETYDSVVFIDNKMPNCQNVARKLPRKSPVEVNTFYYLGHKSSCPTRHSLNAVANEEANDEQVEDEAGEGLGADELDLR